MSYIEIIKESQAEGKLDKLYKQLGAKGDDSVANILRVHSLNPETIKAHLELYKAIMFKYTGLSRVQREMIAVVTSAVNECFY
ncbi:carboxymuconolactone decarboxylase family protein [Mycoplasmatota bacterium zrk1]